MHEIRKCYHNGNVYLPIILHEIPQNFKTFIHEITIGTISGYIALFETSIMF